MAKYRYRGPGGRFVKQTAWKRAKKRGSKKYKREEIIILSPDHMWRVTVSAPYSLRSPGKKKRREGSIATSYRVTGHYSTADEARASIPTLKKVALSGREEALLRPKTFYHGKKDHVNIEAPTSVKYDSSLLNTYEERDEAL